MRLIDEASLEALGGSRPADSLTVWAWRDGSLVVPDPLQVISWSLDDEAGESVKVGQKLSLTVADPDGSLGAWRLGDPLGVAGTRLQVVYRVGGSGAVNLGWFRVVGNEPDVVVDSRVVPEYGLAVPDSAEVPHERRRFVTTGVVRLDAVDLTVDVDRDRFEAPESPAAGSTVVTEFRRLTSRYFPTVVDPGVVDVTVPGMLVFDRERLEACQDLLGRVSARYRMGGDGECHVYPIAGSTVWRVEPGEGLVSVSRKQAADGLYNRWVVEGKDKVTGDPFTATASVETGPLRYGGPHGRAPFFYSSEMIETYDQAAAYARELRAKFFDSLAVELQVTTVPRPELQAGDRIEVGCPVSAGHVVYFPGVIRSLRRGGDPSPGPTTLTVACSYELVDEALSRTEWAEHLGNGLPALTWDRMPGNWGTFPAIIWNDLP